MFIKMVYKLVCLLIGWVSWFVDTKWAWVLFIFALICEQMVSEQGLLVRWKLWLRLLLINRVERSAQKCPHLRHFPNFKPNYLHQMSWFIFTHGFINKKYDWLSTHIHKNNKLLVDRFRIFKMENRFSPAMSISLTFIVHLSYRKIFLKRPNFTEKLNN